MHRNALTVAVVTPLALVAAISLTACGEASSATTSSVVNLDSTNYFTIPVTQSSLTTTTVPQELQPGQVTIDVTLYEVQPGDTRTGVAQYFGIELGQLDAANLETAGYESFIVGLVIRIPPGATIPSTTAPPTTVDKCQPQPYVLVSGDTPLKIANRVGVTLEELNAANAGNEAYVNFIVGDTIFLPPTAEGC